MRSSVLLAVVLGLAVSSCGGTKPPAKGADVTPPASSARTTFASDLAFLKQHGDVIVLDAPGGGRVAVSAQYQGRVMTSAVGDGGDSLGFVYRAFIEGGKTGTPFDNYGGEDRFWLGPEGGQFGLYFPPGKPFGLDTWQTPASFQEGAWAVTKQSAAAVSFARSMKVVNYSGAAFQLDVTRDVRVLSPQDVEKHLGVELGPRVSVVAFESDNRIRNSGEGEWKEDKGLVSIWILGMFAPAPDAKVIIPFDAAPGPVANDAYFGKVPADRLKIDEKRGVLVFSCDGAYRSKIGLGPVRARSVAGSYSPSARLLTVVQYDKPKGATKYVNSMWEVQKEPYGGDVLNSYNDGPPAPGKPSLGGFYELETSSPAAALAPGASLVHKHRTFHFVGEPADLEAIAQKALGVSLDVQ